MSRAVLVPPDFDPAPSAGQAVLLEIAGPADADGASGPAGTGALGVLVAEAGEPPERLGIDRAALARSGFDGRAGQALPLPQPDGRLRVAVGYGDAGALRAATARDAAAAFARAAARDADLAFLIDAAAGLDPRGRRPGRGGGDAARQARLRPAQEGAGGEHGSGRSRCSPRRRTATRWRRARAAA